MMSCSSESLTTDTSQLLGIIDIGRCVFLAFKVIQITPIKILIIQTIYDTRFKQQ